MTQKHDGFRRRMAPHHAPVEAHLILARHAQPERCLIPVDGQPSGTDPLFRLAPRGKPELRENLLQALRWRAAPGNTFARRAQESNWGPAATSSLAALAEAACSSSSALSSSGIAAAWLPGPPSANVAPASSPRSSCRLTSAIAVRAASGGSSASVLSPK